MDTFNGHFSDPTQVNDHAFGIFVGDRRVFGSPNIACAFNMWNFAKGLYPDFRGYISIRDERGAVLYIHRQN